MSESPPYPPKSEDGKVYKQNVSRDTALSEQTPTGWSAWFGGRNVSVGPRIGPVLAGIPIDSDSDDSSSAILNKQLALEDGHAIKYRTCSWQKTAALLFSEYICLVRPSHPRLCVMGDQSH
jgi:hypothetical protein